VGARIAALAAEECAGCKRASGASRAHAGPGTRTKEGEGGEERPAADPVSYRIIERRDTNAPSSVCVSFRESVESPAWDFGAARAITRGITHAALPPSGRKRSGTSLESPLLPAAR